MIVQEILLYAQTLSALQALEGDDFRNPFLLADRYRIHYLTTNCSIRLSFLWMPSQIGIKGNEKVDKLAKQGLSLRYLCDQKLPHSDYKPLINITLKQMAVTLG